MRDSRNRERSDGERLFTFGLRYDWGVEELDIFARTYDNARELALKVAELDYEIGWTELIDMNPGGSAGLIQVWS